MAAHASRRCKAGRAPRICLLFNVGLESKKVEEEREKKRVGRAKVLHVQVHGFHVKMATNRLDHAVGSLSFCSARYMQSESSEAHVYTYSHVV